MKTPLISMIVLLLLALPTRIAAEDAAAGAAPASDRILLTVMLRHDQSKSLAELQAIQERQGFYKNFPPAGTRIVSWHVVMGIGQVVTLEVPAAKLREVNIAVEKSAWGAFRSEFYPTYDLYPVIREKLGNAERVP